MNDDTPLWPRTRGECPPASEPCWYVACRYHLWTWRGRSRGRLLLRESRVWGRRDLTCALRIAERGPQTLDAVGRAMGLTRERVRQIEFKALAQLRENDEGDLHDLLEACSDFDPDRSEGLDDRDEHTTDDTGAPDFTDEPDDTGQPDWSEPDRTGDDVEYVQPPERRGQKAASMRRARDRLRAAAEESPAVPCPGCGRPMPLLTRKGTLRQRCSGACAHRHVGSPSPPGLGPGRGPAGDAGDDDPPFPLATAGNRGSEVRR